MQFTLLGRPCENIRPRLTQQLRIFSSIYSLPYNENIEHLRMYSRYILAITDDVQRLGLFHNFTSLARSGKNIR